jgi:hypothetical protein
VVRLPPLFRRLHFSVFFMAAGFAALARAGVSRDWNQFPPVVQASIPKALYVMGDVHGDYDRMVGLLAGTHLIAPAPATLGSVQWTGGDAVLVCTGDMIDKFDHGLEVIALLRALQIKAKNAGGRVIVTMGNHEADFLAASGSDTKAAEFEAELQSAGISAADLAAGKDSAGIGAWLRNLPIAAKVGDWFFCHAGDTGGMSVAQLDQQMEVQVAEHGFNCPLLEGEHSLLQARMHPRPWWDWDGQPPTLKDAQADNGSGAAAGERRLRVDIAALGVHHLVFGHQPGKIKFADGTERAAGEMFQKYDGLVFLIDTGMSRGVAGGRGALLHITDGSVHGVSAVYASGASRTLVK